MIDKSTTHLGLPLPHEQNLLEDDCPRIAQSLQKLDFHAQKTDGALQKDSAAIGALEDRAAAVGLTLAAIDDDLSRHSGRLAALESAIEAAAAERAAEAGAREEADAAHEASTDAHAALFRHLATGSLSPVIGICLAEEGGGAGSWVNVDVEGNPVSPPKSYFDHHPVYSGIRRVLVDGQIMQEHAKFYHKTFEIASGLLSGRWARVISPEPLEGFRLFPSFMKAGQEIDHWYCGAYQAIDTTPDAATAQKILGSRPGRQPFTKVDFPTMQSLARARNVGGVTGFDMWDIYQLAEIQLLYLIEYANSDSRAAIGPGWVDGQWRTADNVFQFDAKNVDDPTVASASWRGHVGLWGNVWQMVDGLRTRQSDKHVMIYRNDGSKTWVDTGIAAPERVGFVSAWPVDFRHQAGDGFDLGDVFYPQSLAEGAPVPSGASVPAPYWGWSQGYCDDGDRMLWHGGGWGEGAEYAALFCCDLSRSVNSAEAAAGCRIARS